MDTLRFFNPYAEIRHTENNLPHWQQHGAVYFITFRLADAIPAHLRNQWENERAIWLRLHPEPWSIEVETEYHKRFSGAIEHWLDAGHGSCLLRRSECAKTVAETLRHFDGERLALITSVVMPNHVHAVFVKLPISHWKNCCEAGKHLPRERSMNCSVVPAVCGNGIISIALFVTRCTSQIACATSDAIRKKRGCGVVNTFFMKVS